MRRRFQYPSLLRAAVFLCLVLGCWGCKKTWDATPVDYIGQEPFSFFVAGHVYGNPVHADSSYEMYPPFKAELTGLAADERIELGVLTGDFVEQPEADYYDRLEADLAVFEVPIRLVPGNHDTKWWGGSPLAGEFDKRFGARFGKLRHKRSLFLFLDSNQHHWRIQGAQLEMVEREMADLEDIDQVFVFTHNILWWDSDTAEVHHFPTPNSTWNRHPEVLFWEVLIPVLKEGNRPVWVFAGDTGANCNGREVTYWNGDGLHLISNGMGCDDSSSFLVVHVGEDVRVEIRGLDGADMGSLSDWRY